MFCISEARQGYGTGKIIAVKGGEVEIEYFSSPVSKPTVVSVPKQTVKPKTLSPQTRVYWNNPEDGFWRVGRVLDAVGNTFTIQFPNRQIYNLPSEELFVRWSKPIEDPTAYLANFINETPLFSESRENFVRCMVQQRGISEGMSALLSSVIELEPHQINVVRRVLKDPIQRYLLADEVGLGKTIEAGVVIRQHVLDRPVDHCIVVLVPPSLLNQWRQELSRRFLLQHFLGESIFVIANDDLQALKEISDPINMLVIDEAQHIVRDLDLNAPHELYCVISDISERVERLLLLSATPALGNESGFLALLHLLDPDMYSLRNLDLFKLKIANRQELAHVVAEFVPENVYFLGDALQRLIGMFPDDILLNDIASELRTVLDTFPDENDPNLADAVAKLRLHVTETYKLHRRILRNRRSKVTGLTPERMGVITIEYESPTIELVAEILEDWRGKALDIFTTQGNNCASDLPGIFVIFIEALLCDPLWLADLTWTRLGKKSNTANPVPAVVLETPLFAGEREILEAIYNAIQGGEDDYRTLAIQHEVRNLACNGQKVVLFANLSSTADKLYQSLYRSMGRKVVRHSYGMEDGDSELHKDSIENVQDWSRFLNDDNCLSLVCDLHAEEGLNLQGGKKLAFHVDMPLSPNRIEQRMGRVDRYGAGGDIQSVVALCKNNPYERDWYHCLSEGFNVFNRSIASLQYLVDEEMKKLKAHLFTEGAGAIVAFTTVLCGEKGIIAEELRRIDLQDELDAMGTEHVDQFEETDDIDSDWETIQDDVDNWVEKSLLFQKIPAHIDGNPPPDRVFRYQFNLNATRNTLVPFGAFLTNFLPVIDLKAKGNAQAPKTYAYSFRRQTAVHKRLHLLRYGDEFLNGVLTFTGQDDRGKSFALWRYIPGYKSLHIADLFFRFDFIIEANLSEALSLRSEYADLPFSESAIEKLGDIVFPPQVRSVWIDSDFQLVKNEVADQLLELRYSKMIRQDGSQDFNLKPERWEIVRALELPFLDYWTDMCNAASDKAKSLTRESADLKDLIDSSIGKARVTNEAHYSQLRSRIAVLEGTEAEHERKRLEFEQTLDEALLRGAINPVFRIDSAGAIFVSGSTIEPRTDG